MQSIAPDLSRSEKARTYAPAHPSDDTGSNDGGGKRQKRKRVAPCFTVKPCDHGVGMFSSCKIPCGSLIVAHEAPIVVFARQHTPLLCQFCSGPIGDLRDHLGAPKEMVLPYIGNTPGPQFTSSRSTIVCTHCHDVTWCSRECFNLGKPRHAFVCQKATAKSQPLDELEKLYETVDDPAIWGLAIDAVSLILASSWDRILVEIVDKKIEEKATIHSVLQPFLFWKDYGSHPLWWKVGNEDKRDQRLSQSQRFAQLMRVFFSVQCRRLLVAGQHFLYSDLVVQELCSLENTGQLLGMLQCNVMEFEYLSPAEQYIGQLEQDDECEDEELGGETRENDNTLSEGLEWLDNHRTNSPQLFSPIVGSGLYPLLTLANHDCDPNASIDFLQESNRGSMVALRDICEGEEICITYVPNGDLDPGGTSERFRHFQPTGTWQWLNQQNDEHEEDSISDPGTCSNDDDDDDHDGCNEDNKDDNEEKVQEDVRNTEEDDAELEVAEGADQSHRSVALLEYGFACLCRRCAHEKAVDAGCYTRD